jgi:two-component system, NtrC family, response regulator PilR
VTASQTRTVRRQSLRERLRVLLFGRVLVVTVFLAAAGSLTLIGSGPRRDIGTVTFWIVAAAYAGTLASALLVRRVARAEALAYLQVVFDVLLLTGAIALVGHIEGPWILLYILPITSAAALLMLPGAFTAAALSTIAYAVIVGGAGDSHAATALWTGFAAIAFSGVAWAAGVLSRRLDSVEDELAQREREMNRLEDVHRALAHGLECGVLVVGANDQVRSANPASQQILGLTAAGMVGRDIHWLMPCLATAEADGESARAGDPVECEHRAGDGSTRRMRVKRSALRDTYGNHCGSLLILQDVTRLLELEACVANDSEAALHVADDDAADEAARAPVDGLVGNCPPMRAVAKLVDKVADADATVLITGESGTGKEVVARAIHQRSARANGPFVVVNCGAIPENLIESELFGHVRGAFTGAVADRPGLFRRAHGGTIFLDEIGELPLALQVRLLRVLQDRTVMPVGGNTPVAVDVRVLAATNRVLEELVKAGQYREDLYYRLAVISIEMPPLRERGKDLEVLIEHFVRRAGARHGKRVDGVSGRAMQLLLRYSYPGNVRELENVIEHAATLTEGPTIREVDLPDSVREGSARARPTWASLALAAANAPETPTLDALAAEAAAAGVTSLPPVEPSSGVLLPVDEGEGTSLDDQLARREKEMLLAALARAAGVKKRAATLLGINYRSFRHRLQKYGLDSHGDDVLPRFGAELPRESGH